MKQIRRSIFEIPVDGSVVAYPCYQDDRQFSQLVLSHHVPRTLGLSLVVTPKICRLDEILRETAIKSLSRGFKKVESA